MKELKGLQDSVKEIEKLFTDYEDMLLLIEMSEGEDEEQEAAEEIEEELGIFEEVFEKLRISTLLIGPYDADNAIVTLHAGAGGTEAMDWTSMLYRMYSRWAEKRGYDLTFINTNLVGQKMSYLEHCRYRNFDGVVIVCASFEQPEVQEEQQTK